MTSVSPKRVDVATRVKDLVVRFGTVAALIILVGFFQLQTGNFISTGNIAAILGQAAVLVMLAGGLTLCLTLGQFDLSVGWVASVAAMVCTGLMSEQGVPLAVALAAAVGVGIAVGIFNGFLVVILKINALLATLASGSILAGISSWYSITPFSTGLSDAFIEFGITSWGWLPAPALAAGIASLSVWVFLQHTVTGRRMYAVGGNPEAARVAGVNVGLIMFGAFVTCSAMSAIGGVLLAAQLGSGQPQSAVGLMLGTFAAAFLGAATWREGQFHIGGTIVGVLILGVIFSGLSLLSSPAYVNDMATGAILILAVGMSTLLRPRT